MSQLIDLLEFPLLHIYQQPSHHIEACIFGTRSGLEALREAIDKALADPKAEPYVFYQNDGEGYDVVIKSVKPAWFDALPNSYTDFDKEFNDVEQAAMAAVFDGRALDTGGAHD